MGALATTLKDFTDNGDSRTFALATHTAAQPRLVIQKRKVPTGNRVVAEISASVIYGTEDDDGAVLAEKIGFTMSGRYPIDGQSTDIDAAWAVFQDVVQSDEMTAALQTQFWLPTS